MIVVACPNCQMKLSSFPSVAKAIEAALNMGFRRVGKTDLACPRCGHVTRPEPGSGHTVAPMATDDGRLAGNIHVPPDLFPSTVLLALLLAGNGTVTIRADHYRAAAERVLTGKPNALYVARETTDEWVTVKAALTGPPAELEEL